MMDWLIEPSELTRGGSIASTMLAVAICMIFHILLTDKD